jgi:uncharacterized membrane protein
MLKDNVKAYLQDMFSSSSILVQVSAVLLSIGFLIIALYMVARLLKEMGAGKSIFVALAAFIMTAICVTWIIDIVFAFKIDLLSEAERISVFELMKSFFLLVVGAYFQSLKKE